MTDINSYLVLCVCIFAGIHFWRKWQSSRKRLPPGPSIFTTLIKITAIVRCAHKQIQKWSETYGPIVRLKLGSFEMVVINDYKLIKELFGDKATSGRTLDNPMYHELGDGNHGVLTSECGVWEEQRRFMLRTLKGLGFAKTSMETVILDEANALLNWFRKFNGNPVAGLRVFNAPVINSLWRIVNGERCDWEEKKPEILERADNYFASVVQITQTGIVFAPALRHLAPEYLGWNNFVRCVARLTDCCRNAVESHKETFDNNNIRDFIDAYLNEMEHNKDPNSTFSGTEGYKNLVISVFDLFTAGSETMSNTLSWVLKYCIAYPHIQEKVAEEISQVLGSRTSSLSDRESLPYTESFITEVLRKEAFAPLGVAHRMMEDKNIAGYFLPKGTQLLANIYAVHHNLDIWGDPENFRPERFLNEDGSKFVKSEYVMVFSEGKRKCIGETMARDTLFLFITSILQNFKVLAVEDEKLDMESEHGFFVVPRAFNMRLVERRKN